MTSILNPTPITTLLTLRNFIYMDRAVVTRGWLRGLPQLPSIHAKSQVLEIHKH
jgi:hypothetical protein